MSDDKSCVLCGVSGNDKPLIQAVFKDKPVGICPGCMPAVIHGPGADQLSEKLKD